MILGLPPGLLLIIGALLAPFLRGYWRGAYMLVLIGAGFWGLLQLDAGVYYGFELFGYQLAPVRIDKLSLIFGYVFHIAAFLSVIYALHNDDPIQNVASLAYAGSGIGAVFAGDFITLFFYWEVMAISSVFLIWARGTERAYASGMRYLIIQIMSGVLLIAGAVLHAHQTGSIAFDKMELGTLATWLIFLSFGIKCAFPFLHNWMVDAYPEATVTGTVFLSAFTTKLAVYALARGFPGTEMLIYIGAAMTVFPILYAVIENDLRRVLAYSLNNQLGFMVVGVGIGTSMALNGAAAHAFAHILYKSLLFMSMGAVLYRVGTIKASDLGGLYKSMPITMVCCLVGAASISAFPLFSGFVAKSLTMSALGYEGFVIIWLILTFAVAGEFIASGIKIPYFAFFAKDSGKRCREAPWNMCLAMIVTAALCIILGAWSPILYSLVPYEVKYEPYTTSHVVGQLQLVAFAGIAFIILVKMRLYPREHRSTVLDFDWVYRRAIPRAIKWVMSIVWPGWIGILDDTKALLAGFADSIMRRHGPEGVLARTWPTGSTALWVAVLLGALLIIYYV